MDLRIALAGNPNSGKTTLFNALTGSNQFVGNWPGVTVEKKEGRLKGEKDVIITDLPGIYSLSPYTMAEVVARNVLIDQRPDRAQMILDHPVGDIVLIQGDEPARPIDVDDGSRRSVIGQLAQGVGVQAPQVELFI